MFVIVGLFLSPYGVTPRKDEVLTNLSNSRRTSPLLSRFLIWHRAYSAYLLACLGMTISYLCFFADQLPNTFRTLLWKKYPAVLLKLSTLLTDC